MDTMITLKEYKSFWKKKRENTATSPFGLHVGHYKVTAEDDTTADI